MRKAEGGVQEVMGGVVWAVWQRLPAAKCLLHLVELPHGATWRR